MKLFKQPFFIIGIGAIVCAIAIAIVGTVINPSSSLVKSYEKALIEGDEGYSDEYYDEYYGSYEGYNEGMEGYFENSMQTFTGYFQKLYRVEKVLVETNMGLFGGLDRTFTFVLDNEPTDEETTDGEAKEETDENSETSAEPQWNGICKCRIRKSERR